MDQKNYKKLITKTPKHLQWEFIIFLKANNEVVLDSDYWLVVQNIKHHTSQVNWYTAFTKEPVSKFSNLSTDCLVDEQKIVQDLFIEDWFKFENDKRFRSVKRFHKHYTDDIEALSAYFVEKDDEFFSGQLHW